MPTPLEPSHRPAPIALRLSLVAQSTDPAYHLDTDADTALTGEVGLLSQRRILRLLLNLSARSDRTLHYVDVDPWSVDLAAKGSYLCVAHPAALRPYARVLTVPCRCVSTVHGVVFPSNLVLHSGLDDLHGHFVAAYGTEADSSADAWSRDGSPRNAASTWSRNSRCRATPTLVSPNTH